MDSEALRRCVGAPTDWAERMLGADLSDPDVAAAHLVSKYKTSDLFEIMSAALVGDASVRNSFLYHADGGRVTLCAVLRRLASSDPTRCRDALLSLATSDSLYIPFNVRAAAVSELSVELDRVSEQRLRASIIGAPPRYKNLAMAVSSGIDHTFEIPDAQPERDSLLESASRAAMRIGRDRLLARAVGVIQPPAQGVPFAPDRVYLPAEVDEVFKALSPPRSLAWTDFVIDWNRILVETPSESYTVAEILRLLLLDPNYHLPGNRQRAIADAVNLNVLRVFSGARIGLKAGVLFVEHGFEPESSFFLMSENAVLGKGCIVDATGAVIIEPSAFLGGGFSPLLVHTHKHGKALRGERERKTVHPCGFVARRGARLPMTFVGLLEVHDMREPRWPGIERMDIAIGSRVEIG